MRRLLIILWLSAMPASLMAQTAPTPSETAGFSPLFAAALRGSADDVRAALANGASVSETDSKDRLAIHVAGFASNEPALIALAEAGADMNALEYQLYDVVTIAAVANDSEMLRAALANGNAPDLITSVYVGTALIAAAHLGHHEVTGILIKAGAPLDHANNLGWTALMESVVLGDGGPDHVETARLLVAAGADRSIADRDGITPREHAKRRGYTAMVDVLTAD